MFISIRVPTVDLCLIICISISYNIKATDTEIVLIHIEHLSNRLIVLTTYNLTTSSILELQALFKSLRVRTRSIRSYIKLRINRYPNYSLVEGRGGGLQKLSSGRYFSFYYRY